MESPPRLASYLAAHHGVLSRSQALRLGLSPDQIAYRLRTGWWLRAGPGVYRLATTPDAWPARARAAALSCRGLISHTSALRAWGVDGWTDHRGVHVTIEASRRLERRGIDVVRSITFDRTDGRLVGGIPVTGIDRSVLDAAANAPDRIDQIVDAVLRQRLTTLAALTAEVERAGTRGRAEAGKLRRLLLERDPASRVPDSRFNRLVAELLVGAGLPGPRFEHEIPLRGGRTARVDLAYPSLRLAIELDSARWHHDSRSFVADRRRTNQLLLAGWRVLSFTWTDAVDRPGDLVAVVGAALARTG